MTWSPMFRLYTAGGSLVYTFPAVQSTNIPKSAPRRYVEVSGQRGKGAIIIDGGEQAYDIELSGILVIDPASEGYQELTVLIDGLNDLSLNTPYVLRLDKTPTTYYEYKVKILNPVEFSESQRISAQEYRIQFRANVW